MDEDVWDLFVVQQFFEEEYVKRLGAQRAKHIDVQPQYIYSGTRAYAASYFTKGRGFLALDVGLKIRAHRLPIAQIVGDRKSTRLNSSHVAISYAVFCLTKKRPADR